MVPHANRVTAMIYQVYRIDRTINARPAPTGSVIVQFQPIHDCVVKAPDDDDALKLAQRLLPTLRHHLAVGPL